MLKRLKLAILLLVSSSISPVFAGGPYEAVATVTNYDPSRQLIVLDGNPHKLKGKANSNLIVSIREAGLTSLKGVEVSYRVDTKSKKGNVIVDVHVPVDD